MELPFPHIEEHKKYPSTFLINVEWRLHFNINNTDSSYDKFYGFIKDTFGLELRREDYNAMGILPLRYSQSEDAANIKISNKFAEFSFNSNGYTSFGDSARDILVSFVRLIYQCEGSVNHIMCNKKNLVTMQRNFECDESEILSIVFSDSLIEAPSQLVRPADFTRDTVPSTHFYTVSAYDLIIQALYGVYGKPGTTEYNGMAMYEYGAMLESQCDCPVSTNAADECIRRIDSINDVMYDFIHWALSPHIFRIMETENQNGESEFDVIEIE
ncbi:MAG: hypothetical protein K2H86_04235 [Muribaculaceae bacterium]|nr:hypothetical protein [Muribaculaceae bacterium]